MELKEALDIIGLPKTASEDEFKAKYKKLAKTYHPDIYKENPDKFKEINEAYQTIQDYKANPEKYDNPFGRMNHADSYQTGFGINFQDFFSNFPQDQQHVSYNHPPIICNITIDFTESVIGANKDIKYNKFIKCNTCDGKGSKPINNGCKNCNGFGRIITNNKNMMFTTACMKCRGRDVKFENCNTCSKKGVLEVEVSGTIQIPSGTLNNSTLRLGGAGHYFGSNILGESYADAFVRVSVKPDKDLSIVGNDVVFNLKLQLVDAVVGCKKVVKTINGEKEISIPALSKNKEEVRLENLGVKSANGVQRVIFDVEYPKDIEKLTTFLKEQNGISDKL